MDLCGGAMASHPWFIPGISSEVCDGLSVLGLSAGGIFKWESKPLQREVLVLSDHIIITSRQGINLHCMASCPFSIYLHYFTYVALRYVWCCFVQLHDVRPGVLERLASVQTFHPFSCFILSCDFFFYHCEIWLTNGVYFQKYIYDHRSEDCLLSGFQGSRNPNPFRERSSCNVL